MDVYVPLLVGWVLGLLSPHFTGWIARRSRRCELKRTIKMEFEELRVTLATAAWIMLCKTGELDVKFMRWYLPIALSSRQSIVDALPREKMVPLSQKTDSELQVDVDALISLSATKGHGLNLKKYELPFLTAHQSELVIFDNEFQKNVLEVISSLRLFNSDVDMVRTLSLKVFEPGMQRDIFDTIYGNLHSLYRSLAVRAKDICDVIDHLSKI